MRAVLKIGLIGIGAIALVLMVGFALLFFDSRGLPEVEGLAQFAPATVAQVTDRCLKSASIAIPYDSIGDNMRSALSVAEVWEVDPGVFTAICRGLSNQNRSHRATLSLHISRTMFCAPARPLTRQLNELRTAVQLERHFSRRALFTIFANRLVFGQDIVGVQAASQHFFHKEPSQLLVGEAALLAGLVKAPSYFSPTGHPDRALQRRNEIIDAMVQTNVISQSDATAAKASALPVVTD